MDLSIIIPSFNTRQLLDKVLLSIEQSPKTISIETFVVDNASSDGSALMVQNKYPRVMLLQNDHNVGFARANNQALRICSGRYALLLNSDAEVLGSALQTMVEFADNNPDIGILGPQLLYPDGTLQPSGNDVASAWEELLWITALRRLLGWKSRSRYFQKNRDYGEILDVEEISGACMIIRRQVWEQIGKLDEGYFFCFEDVDFCMRARTAYWRVTYFPKARVLHHWGKSSVSAPSVLKKNYKESRLRFYRKVYGRLFEFCARGLLTIKEPVTSLLSQLAKLTNFS
ncbi:MAG: glycosyltransferase family 2 protein [Pyrinomonadaceae bacterium]